MTKKEKERLAKALDRLEEDIADLREEFELPITETTSGDLG